MQSGATRTRQRDGTLPAGRPHSQHEPRPAAPGPRFAHDFTRVSVSVQPKLKVNTPGDSYEQEADRVADELSGKSSCACAGTCSSCSSGRIQRKSGAPAAGSADVDPILRGPGHPLDIGTRSLMEPYFGHDFSRVRVHSDPAAAASADSLGARAYTVGHHLVFGPGQYRPGSTDGQRLLAHELTHVTQQSAAGPMIQRDDKETAAPKAKKEIKRGKASTSPELVVKEADPRRQPPCACLVFMHHSEENARHAAEAMHAVCRYNLAIVDPRGGRNIDLPNVGERDPNELFPRHIFRECADDEKPCKEFLDKNKDSTDKKKTEEYAQRQFFLAIRKCSKGFTLPIVALHNNVVSDTAKYQQQLKLKRKTLSTELGKPGLDATKEAKLKNEQADLEKLKGKTFQDTPPSDGTWPKDTLPYADLEQWLRVHMPDLVKERSAAAKNEKQRPTWKKKIESTGSGEMLSGGMTNIIKWCQAHDNSQCYIGDPDRPDNVVWVTREEDFKKLQGSKANVALQTRVTPGESETDLSSMFVASLDQDVIDRLKRHPPAAMAPVPPGTSTVDFLIKVWEHLRDTFTTALGQESLITDKREKVRFVNIENPQSPATGAQRLTNYQDVKSILQPLGLHCCDQASDKQVEAAMTSGVKPKLADEPKQEAPSGTSK